MIRELLVLALASLTTVCVADDTSGSTPAGVSKPARPRQASVAQPESSEQEQAPSAGDAPKFVSEAKWILAGYNNNEVVYTIFVTNQDTRILRCTTEVKGFYFENNEKLSISDRQVTTVFPNQPTQVGYWMDMDEPSGATYSVKCRPT
jgi:hypothetical protein